MSAIKTASGWKRLWTMSLPERPPFPIQRPARPGDEEWRDEQHRVLLEMRRLSDMNV